MNFNMLLYKLRDGKAYKFSCKGMNGYFYKAPFPAVEYQTKLDGACSAITYYNSQNKRSSPTLMLYDFDNDNEWKIEEVKCHPLRIKNA